MIALAMYLYCFNVDSFGNLW